ncbi:MAG: UDP-N-acetylglucosamine 1-carboxyvinyltransferase [Deltaproteobacteria bacterium]|nr:UDP-N-acetylglucosamine 1-carboxyvinyltransferase [Deltaproteobacteria bacterium]
MDKIVIKGGERLQGEVRVSGSKNAALPLLASSILADGESRIRNIPPLNDIKTMLALLKSIGLNVAYKNEAVKISGKAHTFEAPYELVKTMRASALVLGPLLAKYGSARVSMPGGCAIGERPIDLHLKALKAMGAEIELKHGYVIAGAKRLKGATIYFDIITVTGTENIMMAATLAKGKTVIENAAREPEVVELARALKAMGAKIDGEGSDVITIEGVNELGPLDYQVMPDRIEAGTLMAAAAATKGNVLIKNCDLPFMEALISKMKAAGIVIREEEGGLRVIGKRRLKSVDIKTLPHPGFPTDMQAQMMVLMSIASGLSVISETVFENRFMHVSELRRMGADIHTEGRSAIIKGKEKLSGAQVMATDLRASASLIIAGLVAEGTTEVSRIYHLDRGYDGLERKLAALGANIERVKEKRISK